MSIRDTIRSEISLEVTWSNGDSLSYNTTSQHCPNPKDIMLFRGLTRFSVISSFSDRRVRRRAEEENEEEEEEEEENENENENENEEEKEREELRRATKKRRSEALPCLLDYKHSRGVRGSKGESSNRISGLNCGLMNNFNNPNTILPELSLYLVSWYLGIMLGILKGGGPPQEKQRSTGGIKERFRAHREKLGCE
ncbi:hypothetical protein EV360DRAFT_74886 [Lentinula raphanica]|nr:hypothetical protein EV360DRAFT_74886 [Lentinula raphanica]